MRQGAAGQFPHGIRYHINDLVTEADATHLLAPALPGAPNKSAIWADLGAGTGTFTQALAGLLGANATVHAVERNANALHALKRLFAGGSARHSAYATVITHLADFTTSLALPPLDGVLMANALHFVARTAQVKLLSQLAQSLGHGGRIVLVEYDRATASQWVPYPISAVALPSLAQKAGLGNPHFAARAPSAFGGDMYCAWMATTP